MNQQFIVKSPALTAYTARIGAVQKSLRKFAVEQEGPPGYGYIRNEISTIKIKEDGNVEVRVRNHYIDPKFFEPTKDEAAAIRVELASVVWPKSIWTTKAKLAELCQKIGGDPTLFVFLTEKGDEVCFVQQRIHPKEGGKRDIPWSFWSDGEWRNQEPDGELPLFGLHLMREGRSIMIHEGAKAAQEVQKMCHGDDPEDRAKLAKHPWGEILRAYNHLGWTGGANRPHGSDWGPIKELPSHVDVVLACDNDQVGKEAASTISKLLKRSLKALMFGDHFPRGFDLADDWPSHDDWWAGSIYRGPTFDNCISPATWATQKIKTEGSRRPSYAVRAEFADEWMWSVAPPLFVHTWQTNKTLTADEFNRNVRPYSDAEDTGRLLIKYVSSRYDGVTYKPFRKRTGRRNATVLIGEQRLINTYRPPEINPLEGDPEPWIEFVNNLFPNKDDRDKALRWIATLIARPDVRMHYGLLLISETQGVGKGTLLESILSPLLGPWNVSTVKESDIESGFNDWQAHARLAAIHEIYSGHNKKAYNKLKSVITDSRTKINTKFLRPYEIDICCHVVACSNSVNALNFDFTDRRWLVPRVTEKKPPLDYWIKFHAWLKAGGLGTIAWWAEDFVQKHGHVVTGESAPETSMKKEVIEASWSEGQKLVDGI